MYDRHSKSKITNHIRATLPLEDFTKWNFSRAWEIIDSYENFLAICLSESKNKILWWENIEKHLYDELKKLESEKEKLESELKEILDKISEFDKLTVDLKKEYEWNKNWEAIRLNFKHKHFDAQELEDFLDEIAEKNWENYKKWEKEIKNFLNSENYKRIKEWQEKNNMRILKAKRNSIKKKLNHKSNKMNLDNQIEEIRNWRKKEMLQKNIKSQTKEIFGKKLDFFDREEDTRSLKEIYMWELASMIILNKNTDNKLRHELIKRHNDKIWLWNYVWDIYWNLRLSENRIRENLWIENSIEINFSEDMKKSIIEEIKYWVNFCKEQYPMWHNAINDSDIESLEKFLNSEKKHEWNIEISENRRIREIFYTLRDYLEHSELENKFEMIWNYDYMWIETNINNLKNILKYLFKYMDENERKDIIERYGYWNTFKGIEKESIKENNQLSLFD